MMRISVSAFPTNAMSYCTIEVQHSVRVVELHSMKQEGSCDGGVLRMTDE